MVNKEKHGLMIVELHKQGIEATSMYVVHWMRINAEDFPRTKKVADEILTLPCHPKLNTMDLKKVPMVIKEVESE